MNASEGLGEVEKGFVVNIVRAQPAEMWSRCVHTRQCQYAARSRRWYRADYQEVHRLSLRKANGDDENTRFCAFCDSRGEIWKIWQHQQKTKWDAERPKYYGTPALTQIAVARLAIDAALVMLGLALLVVAVSLAIRHDDGPYWWIVVTLPIGVFGGVLVMYGGLHAYELAN